MRQLEETLLLLAGQDQPVDPDQLIHRIEQDLSAEDVPVVAWDERRMAQTNKRTRLETQPRPSSKAWVVAVAAAAIVAAIGIPLWLVPGAEPEVIVSEPVELLTLAVHPEGVSSVAWSPDGSQLATASSTHHDGSVANVWDAVSGDELLVLDDDAMGRVGFSPDGTRMATSSGIYDAATGEKILGSTEYLAYNPDGTRIAVGGAWGAAGIIDASTGNELVSFPLSSSWVWAAAWSPDGAQLATTWGITIKVWDAVTGEEALTIQSGRVTEIAWSPDGTRILTANRPGDGPSFQWTRVNAQDARIWDAETGQELTSIPVSTWAVAWSPDGTRFVTGREDGTARIWDAITYDELATLAGHSAEVTDVAWSPDGTRIATAGEDGTVKVWQVG